MNDDDGQRNDIDLGPLSKPHTAFQSVFPGSISISERPDTLEYEIRVTSEADASPGVTSTLTGSDTAGPPAYKSGRLWYFLADKAILKSALKDKRETRTQHKLHASTGIRIDLSTGRRFYFLLSPFQLGAAGLTFAMANPRGLTPLLRPRHNTDLWGSDWMKATQPIDYFGPTPQDVAHWQYLNVIDPYAWAEKLAKPLYETSLADYLDWVGTSDLTSGKNATLRNLTIGTRWTLDAYHVAKILESVHKGHPHPSKIADEIEDVGKWRDNLERWDRELIERNAAISARAHFLLTELVAWMQGPGHAIIETTLLRDTVARNVEDCLDIGQGILHWSICTQFMYALEPGAAYLRDLFGRPGSVPVDIVFKHLHMDGTKMTIPPATEQCFRYAWPAILNLLSLRNFVSPPPSVTHNGSRNDYLVQLGKHLALRRDQLIDVLNGQNILPAALKPVTLPSGVDSNSELQIILTATNGFLDILDKGQTAVQVAYYSKGLGLGAGPRTPEPKFAARLANFSEWIDEKGGVWAKLYDPGVPVGLKVASFGASWYNFYSTVTTARYDYQTNSSTVNSVTWAQAYSGVAISSIDIITEAAKRFKLKGLQEVFPELTKVGAGPKWGVGAMEFKAVAGKIVATVYVVAIVVSGVTAVMAMTSSSNQAQSYGDSTAALFYGIGAVGGVFTVAGGVSLGVGLIYAGYAAVDSGVFATVGIVLIFLGGLLSAIGSIVGSLLTSDEYQVFARKCFLGKQRDYEPRFGKMMNGEVIVPEDPPAWSHALRDGSTGTWMIDKQKRAVYDLLGRFALTTATDGSGRFTEQRDSDSAGNQWTNSYSGGVTFKMVPGLFIPGSTIELFIYYESKPSERASATITWTPELANPNDLDSEWRMSNITKQSFWNPASFDAFFAKDGKGQVNLINLSARSVTYHAKYGTLFVEIALRYPQSTDLNSNVIRIKKRLIYQDDVAVGDVMHEEGKVDDSTEVSELFE
jgi:hypothetical protein